MSIKLDELTQLVHNIELDPAKREEILKAAEALEEEKKSDRTTAPKDKTKPQFVVVVKTTADLTDQEIVAHVFQLDGEDDAGTILTKVKESAVEHNLATKKKSNLVESFDDVPHIKRKFSKNAGYLLKTKEDFARVVVLPKEGLNFGGFEQNK